MNGTIAVAVSGILTAALSAAGKNAVVKVKKEFLVAGTPFSFLVQCYVGTISCGFSEIFCPCHLERSAANRPPVSKLISAESKDPDPVGITMPPHGVRTKVYGANSLKLHLLCQHSRDLSTPRPSANLVIAFLTRYAQDDRVHSLSHAMRLSEQTQTVCSQNNFSHCPACIPNG